MLGLRLGAVIGLRSEIVGKILPELEYNLFMELERFVLVSIVCGLSSMSLRPEDIVETIKIKRKTTF